MVLLVILCAVTTSGFLHILIFLGGRIRFLLFLVAFNACYERFIEYTMLIYNGIEAAIVDIFLFAFFLYVRLWSKDFSFFDSLHKYLIWFDYFNVTFLPASRCGRFKGFLSWQAKSSSLLDVFMLLELLVLSVGYIGIVPWLIICFSSTAVSDKFVCE